MAKGIDDVRERLEKAAKALDDVAVAYAVVGGNTVAAWVLRMDASAVRNKRYVDILLKREDMRQGAHGDGGDGFHPDLEAMLLS